MLLRPILVATATVLLLLGLGGCASSSGAPNKVQAAVESLGGNPDARNGH